jgi:hypothetical protein
VALRSFVIDGRVESEPPRSRMIDVAVYMGMFAFWVENKKQILEGAHGFVKKKTCCENGRDTACHRGLTMVTICDRCRFLYWLEDQTRVN